MKKRIRLLIPPLLALCAACSPSAPHKDSVIGAWQVMVAHAGKSDMLCYAGARPASSSGTAVKRDGKPFLMATRRPSGKIEISASAGYEFLRSGKVELAAGGKTHSLFFVQSVAWARSDAEDQAIIAAIQNAGNADMIEVRSASQAGETAIDAYSPQGFAGAVARIRELCP